ncbi:hypothetical protein [Actinoplanes sp. NPDC048796]
MNYLIAGLCAAALVGILAALGVVLEDKPPMDAPTDSPRTDLEQPE